MPKGLHVVLFRFLVLLCFMCSRVGSFAGFVSSVISICGGGTALVFVFSLDLFTSSVPNTFISFNAFYTATHDQRLICCSSCAGWKSSDDRGKTPCASRGCASSSCRERTILSTENCRGRYSVITRSGIQTKLLSIIRDFYDGMRGSRACG